MKIIREALPAPKRTKNKKTLVDEDTKPLVDGYTT
jgi:hypothetical protein